VCWEIQSVDASGTLYILSLIKCFRYVRFTFIAKATFLVVLTCFVLDRTFLVDVVFVSARSVLPS